MTDPKPCRHDLLSCFECEPSTIDDPLPPAPEPQEVPRGELDLPVWDLPLAEPGISSRLSDESVDRLARLMATETSWDHGKVNAHADELARAYLALRAEVERLKSERVNKRLNPSEPTPFEHCLAENERLKAEILKRDEEAGYQDVVEMQLRAEVERLTQIIHDLEDPHQAALEAARKGQAK